MDPHELTSLNRKVGGDNLYRALKHLLGALPEETTITIGMYHKIVRALGSWDELDRKRDQEIQQMVLREAQDLARQKGEG